LVAATDAGGADGMRPSEPPDDAQVRAADTVER
jgi:hypothetical protein